MKSITKFVNINEMEEDWEVDFSQLWIEEQRLLAEIASLVPDNGTIVEIGTAQGGSAFIFHIAAGFRGVKIYSFDIAPSVEAYEHLKETSVTILAKSSKEGAFTWMQTIGRPIDLLFIDGSHALQHVFEDFNSWVPFLKPGGKIIFHDYDPVERGGLVHLGVRIVLDTILRCGLLDEPVHHYRMLVGTVTQPEVIQLDENDCYQTFVDLGRQIVHIRDSNYSGWTIVDNGQFAKLAGGCLKIHGTVGPISPDEASDPNGKYLVFARPLPTVLHTMQERGIPSESILPVDNLQACYIVAHALERNREHLLTLTSSRKEFFRWEEVLFMFEHAFGTSQFPDKVIRSAKSDVGQLSRLVAREQVRLIILSHLLKTFVDWTP